nr:PREDICTED: organic cation transporter protein-like [Bemisia tabaci]
MTLEGDEKNGNSDDLEPALESIGQKVRWQFILFLLVSAPGVLNAIHISVYVFVTHNSPHWCTIPDLENANWTSSQIRSFSIPENVKDWNHSCTYYNWNYTLLAPLGFDDAKAAVSTASKPEILECKKRSFLEDEPESSIESEWDLVCDQGYLKSVVQSVFALGKFTGAIIFGLFSCRFGRKRSFSYAAWLYMISVPASNFIYSFPLFLLSRYLIGVAGAGVYETAYTILSEFLVGKWRTRFCTLFNISYPVGMMILPLFAYYSVTWRTLQLYLTPLVFVLLLDCWLLPESPKWLVAEKRNAEAWAALKWADHSFQPPSGKNEINIYETPNIRRESLHWYQQFGRTVEKFTFLFTNFELCKRTLISYTGWGVCALVYYSLTFSGDIFAANKYIYIALNGLIEAFAYLAPSILLALWGRKVVCAFLLVCSGIAQMSTLIFHRDQTNYIVTAALIGRFSDSAVFCIMILITSEIFPTAQRNTAVGTGLMMAQVGSVVAPFFVDMLSMQGWYIPSVILGGLSIVTASLFLLLPETKNKPLFNTVDDISPEDRVSFSQCCRYS